MRSEASEFAYFAGVMDGDGSFCIAKRKEKRNPAYMPLLQCVSWRSFICDLQKKFGGHVVMGKPHICKDGTKGKALFRWQLICRDNVRPALISLIPYLKIKKERAEFLLKFIDENPFIRGHVVANEILENRERSYLKMMQFNEWRSCKGNVSSDVSKSMSDDEIFWSYVAGLYDTDGSFSLKRQVLNKGTEVINPRYLPIINLGMTDTRAINYIRNNCNVGKLYLPKNSSTNAGYHYHFGIYTKIECVEFLKRIIPFLRAKTEQAKILLDFCENSKNTKFCKAGIPEKELAYREDCYQRMIQLNKCGVYKPSLIGLETQNWVTRRKQREACSVID